MPTSEQHKPPLKLRSSEVNRKKASRTPKCHQHTFKNCICCLFPSFPPQKGCTESCPQHCVYCLYLPSQELKLCNSVIGTSLQDFYPQLKSHHGNWTSSYLCISNLVSFPGVEVSMARVSNWLQGTPNEWHCPYDVHWRHSVLLSPITLSSQTELESALISFDRTIPCM